MLIGHFFGKYAFQVLKREPQFKLPFKCHTHTSGLLGDDDRQSVATLRHTQSGTMAQSVAR